MSKNHVADFLEIDSAKVTIVGGMSEYALPDPPDEGEERTYIVKARCKRVLLDTVDGERRMVCQMEHYSIYERGKVPIVDDNQGALFGEPKDDGDGDPELPETPEPDSPTGLHGDDGRPAFSSISGGRGADE